MQKDKEESEIKQKWAAELKTFYDKYTMVDPAKGMLRHEFRDAYRESEPKVTDEKIEEAWKHGNKDGDDGLSWEEFMNLVQEGEADEKEKMKQRMSA